MAMLRRGLRGLLLLFLGCGSHQVSGDEQQKVLILADDAYPPYSYNENEEVRGIYVDMVYKAAEKFSDSYQVEVLAVPWKRALHALKQGHSFAAIPPYVHKVKRPYIEPYSVALMEEHVVAYCHQGIQTTHLTSVLKKPQSDVINIGINAGYLILNPAIQGAVDSGNVRIWENRDTRSNLLKLMANKVHCYLNDKLSIQWELQAMRKADLVSSINIQLRSEVMTVMSRTAHIGYTNSHGHGFKYKQDFIHKMDQALIELQSSGEADEIIRAYVSEHVACADTQEECHTSPGVPE